MSSTNLNIKLDRNLKKQSEAIYNELGISLETAISIFLVNLFLLEVFHLM